jgi:molecular chaperone GrpE (heat shock protein)
MQRNLDQMDHLFLTATSVVNTIQADSFLLSVKDVTDPMDRLVRHLGTMEGERQKMAKSIEFVTHAQNNLLIAAIGTIGNRILDRNYKQLMEQIEAADAANKRIVGVMSRLQSRKAIGLSDKSV